MIENQGFLKSFLIIIISLIIVLFIAYSHQEYIIYPGQLRKYDNFYETFLNNRHSNVWKNGEVNPEEITFQNDKGLSQMSYFVKPIYKTINKDTEETEIWVVIGGNGSLALDWINDIGYLRSKKSHHTSKHGHLLIEYPGYGKSSGYPSTETIFKVIQKSINKILKTHKNIKINFICHSLGCASCLYYINKENDPNIISKIRQIILLAPFYTLKDVAVSKYYMPRVLADYLIRHRWDSHKNIKSLDKLSTKASLKIIHGTNDDLIDISQGLELFKEAPNSISKEFIETNDSHNSIAHLKHLVNHVPNVIENDITNDTGFKKSSLKLTNPSVKKKKKNVEFAPELHFF